jgi:hypothetical protein
MSQSRKLLILYLCTSSTACGAGWRSIPTPWPATIRPKQQVQVWSRKRSLELHGVFLTADSVSGIPFQQPLDCDSCRISIDRQQVDSLRIGNSARGFWVGAGLVVFGLLVGAAILCGSARGGCEHAD